MPKYVKNRNRFRPRRAGKLRKRWYFNAGATLPIIGKTNIAFGSGLQKRSLVNMVRNRLEEPLHKLWSNIGSLPPSTAMTQNTIYTLNLTGNIPQGDTDNSRNGDTIHLDALKFKLLFYTDNATDKKAPVSFRVMIVKHDADYLGGTDTLGSGLGATELFMGNNIIPFEQVNSKKVTVLYDKVCKIVPQQDVANHCLSEDIIRLGTSMVYKTGTNYGKHSNYYLVIAGFQNGATVGTTPIGTVQLFGDLIFKDSR